MIKQLLEHPLLYIITFTKSASLPWLVFIHGGPGLNCAVLESLIENQNLFDQLNCNVLFYDQRGCGRSKAVRDIVLHADNVMDLGSVIVTFRDHHDVIPAAIVGHSYGAKLLFDYYQQSDSTIPGIFIATAPSTLTPRVNNMLLDLYYLKSNDEVKYEEVLDVFNDFNDKNVWAITEKLSEVFHKNESRANFYWANMTWKKRVGLLEKKLSLPLNRAIFTSVRRDMYSAGSDQSVAIDSLDNTRYLWINGFHDLVMNGASTLVSNDANTKVFYKSAHYPHVEEHERFC
jgi:proline iminopeptidase